MRKTLQEVGAFFGYQVDREEMVLHAACDSRKVQKGTLFFALNGEKVDGHSFLKEGAAKGGIGAVVSRRYAGPSFGMELFRVPNVKKALQAYARMVFKERSPLVIGITGTVGKTTTKEFLATLLAEKFRVVKNPGNMNSQIGLPLALLNGDSRGEIVVLEMGMSQKGELRQLVEIAPPHLGVLTKLSLAHSAFFDGIEEIAEAKCELFTSKNMKHGFFHLETKHSIVVQKVQVPKTWFHLNDPCADRTLEGLSHPFKEKHLLENFLAASCVARHIGLSIQEIEKGAKNLKPVDHRFQKVEKKGILFIDDAYNASPEAAKAAFSNLPKGKRRIAVFGAMKELGRYEEKSHYEVAKQALPLLDHLICIGEECLPMVEVFKKEGKSVEYFKEKKHVGKHLKEVIKKGDVVLIKGSNSFKLWTLLEEI